MRETLMKRKMRVMSNRPENLKGSTELNSNVIVDIYDDFPKLTFDECLFSRN